MTSRFQSNYTEKGYLMNYNRMSGTTSDKSNVLQFLIELEEIEPKIWRRIQVPVHYNFWDLHVAIQDAMGWKDYHLHQFEIKGKHKRKAELIGIPDFEGSGELPDVSPGWEIWVQSHFNDIGIQATYEYDYGDSWKHKVLLEGYIYRYPKIKYPVCVGGERACPPEDCGGVHGYAELLVTLADREHEDHKAMRKWVGEKWDSEHFNRDEVKFDDPYKRWVGAFLRE